MTIYGHGCVISSNYLSWFEESNPTTSNLEKIMSTEDPKTLQPLSMKDLECLLQYVAEGKLSDRPYKKDTCTEEGFGWVKTFHVLIRLNQLSQKHETFDKEKAQEHFRDCLSRLSDNGFDVNATLSLQNTKPLHLAAFYGCTALCHALVNVGARKEEPRTQYDGFTPLHIASSAGTVETIRELIALGCKVNATANNDCIGRGVTPLIESIYRPEATQLLCDKGANVNARSRDTHYGPTAFDKAIRVGETESAQILLNFGATVTSSEVDTLRVSLADDIAWEATSVPPDEREYSLQSWRGAANRITRYVNSLRFLNAMPFQWDLKPIAVPDIKDDISLEPEDVKTFRSLTNEIKAIANKASKAPQNHWLNVSEQLHVNMNQFLLVLQKYKV